MSKRARYDGPYPSIDVYLPDDEVIVVQRGHQLPADVPAGVRDELLERPDWSEVQQTTTPAQKKES